MKKRVVIVALWFYAVWYAAAVVAYGIGYPDLIGPIVGVIAAAFVATRLRRSTYSLLKDPGDGKGPASIGDTAGQQVS